MKTIALSCLMLLLGATMMGYCMEGSLSAPINQDGLDDILTDQVVIDATNICKAMRLNDVRPQEIALLNAKGFIPSDTHEVLQKTVTISSQETHDDLKVTVDYQKLQTLFPKPTVLQRFCDPITWGTAATVGILCYCLAKQTSE